MKRIVQLLLSLAIAAFFAYIALGHEGRYGAVAAIITLSLLSVACLYDMLQLFLWSRAPQHSQTHVERRKVSKEEIAAAKETWSREGRKQFQ